MEIRFVDVHSHVPFSNFDEDRNLVMQRLKEEGVATIVVGVDTQSSRDAVAFAERYDNVAATIGLHPNTHVETFDPEAYESLVSHSKVVGVGECGLDYYRNDPNDTKDKERQKQGFTAQIEFALAHKKPLMIHGRPSKGSFDAYEDILTLLEAHKSEGVSGNVHFFVGDRAIAERFFDLGFTVSFTGVLTFTHDYDEVVRNAPLEMLLVETDSPFAAPAPHRGKRNEPSFVPLIVEQIATIREEDSEAIRGQLLENTQRVFGFPPSVAGTEQL